MIEFKKGLLGVVKVGELDDHGMLGLSLGALAFLSRLFMWNFHFRTASSARDGDANRH